MTTSPSDARLVYVHDPMCSWCWGFRPTWQRLREQLPSQLPVLRLVGGLAHDSDDPMPMEMREGLQQTWRRIQQEIPGTDFNFDFWTHNTPRRATWPACRAVIAARRLGGDEADEAMTLGIQQAYYRNARNPSDVPVLVDIAEAIGLDRRDFEDLLTSNEIDRLLQQELAEVRALGIDSFPSLRIEQNNRSANLAIHYTQPDAMLAQINDFLDSNREPHA